ncbi:hypothetical protein F0726_02237 [Acidithiobacillus caldus]|nr:hypothetical protein F0726_02237 [Acidithiobacillus caldus]
MPEDFLAYRQTHATPEERPQEPPDPDALAE